MCVACSGIAHAASCPWKQSGVFRHRIVSIVPGKRARVKHPAHGFAQRWKTEVGVIEANPNTKTRELAGEFQTSLLPRKRESL